MDSTNHPKPAGLKDEHLAYLDKIHKAGATIEDIVWFLCGHFRELSAKEAEAIGIYWVNTFEERHP